MPRKRRYDNENDDPFDDGPDVKTSVTPAVTGVPWWARLSRVRLFPSTSDQWTAVTLRLELVKIVNAQRLLNPSYTMDLKEASVTNPTKSHLLILATLVHNRKRTAKTAQLSVASAKDTTCSSGVLAVTASKEFTGEGCLEAAVESVLNTFSQLVPREQPVFDDGDVKGFNATASAAVPYELNASELAFASRLRPRAVSETNAHANDLCADLRKGIKKRSVYSFTVQTPIEKTPERYFMVNTRLYEIRTVSTVEYQLAACHPDVSESELKYAVFEFTVLHRTHTVTDELKLAEYGQGCSSTDAAAGRDLGFWLLDSL